MPLTPGTSLGSYHVTAKIGEGGMGEVYRARDTKLDRDVALKVLPQAFTDDPDRLARFEREAKVLALLNHTNIGHIYGLEEAEGQKALVLELEGPTLADCIRQGPIPIDEAHKGGPVSGRSVGLRWARRASATRRGSENGIHVDWKRRFVRALVSGPPCEPRSARELLQ